MKMKSRQRTSELNQQKLGIHCTHVQPPLHSGSLFLQQKLCTVELKDTNVREIMDTMGGQISSDDIGHQQNSGPYPEQACDGVKPEENTMTKINFVEQSAKWKPKELIINNKIKNRVKAITLTLFQIRIINIIYLYILPGPAV